MTSKEKEPGGGVDVEIVMAEVVDPGPDQKEWTYHTFMLVLSVLVVLASVVMKVKGTETVTLPWSSLPLGPSCYSRIVFGVDCPGCGLTRSFISMGHFDILAAFRFNAAGPLAYLFTCSHVFWQSYQIYRMRCGKSPYFSNWLMLWPVAVLCSLLLQWFFKFWI